MTTKSTERSLAEKRQLLARIKKAEGQLRAIHAMLEDDRYCPDILLQALAARAALTAFSRELMKRHMAGCVKEGIMRGDQASMDEMLDLIDRFIK